jgi:hypothetical protein
VVGQQVLVTSYVGKAATGTYCVAVHDWLSLERAHPNPVWWKRESIRTLPIGLDEQPGGPEQADRIRDAQIAAIDAACANELRLQVAEAAQ